MDEIERRSRVVDNELDKLNIIEEWNASIEKSSKKHMKITEEKIKSFF